MLKTILRGFMGAGAVVLLVACGSDGQGEAEVAQSAPLAAPTVEDDNPNTQEAWDSNPDTQRWIAEAMAIAGDDPDLQFDAGIFCQPSRGVSSEDRSLMGTSQEYLPDSEPFLQPFPYPERSAPVGIHRLFDNFYWIGNNYIGVWLVTSDDGYIMYDAMNNLSDARDVIIPAMESVGLDPTMIRYLVFGHYHTDHTGGGHYLQEVSGAQAVMHWADWELYLDYFDDPARIESMGDPVPMSRDIDAEDGMELTVGDVTATVYQMTGHTPGSLAMIVPVQYQGEEHPILLITAGNAFNNINAFIGGYEHIWDIGIERGVESVMQTHPNTNMNLLARTAYVNDNYPPEVNPLLYGPERTERYINIVRACSRAYIEAIDMF